MTGNPLMQTPGEMLAGARETLSLSLQDVAQRTKIPVPMLAAIELDEYHKISGQLYVKSFLRSYAVDVGLDPEFVLDIYARFSGESGTIVGSDPATVWSEDQVQIHRIGLPWARILTVVAGLLLVAVVVFFLVMQDGDDAVQDSPEPPVETTDAEDPQSLSLANGGAVQDQVGTPAIAEVRHPQERTNRPVISPTDTLALGWLLDSDPVADPPVAEEEGTNLVQIANPETASAAMTDLEQDAASAAEVPEKPLDDPTVGVPSSPSLAVGDLPYAVPGDARMRFGDGSRPPLVLRLLWRQPLEVSVRRDAEAKFTSLVLTGALNGLTALPQDSLEQGKPYRVREGGAVYLGAEDHFSLRFNGFSGLAVTLNGGTVGLDGLRPGQEIILDRFSTRSSDR